MLSLTLGSTPVETRNADIPVVLQNPIFLNNDGKIPGSFMFNFTIPLTDALKTELEHAHRAARKGKPEWSHELSLRFGPLRYKGTARITQINSFELEVSMPIDTGSLTQAFGNTRLRQLEFDTQIDWDPQITFADLTYPFEYAHEQQGMFVHDVWIKPTLKRIDAFNGFDIETGEFTVPETANYRVSLSINSSYGYAELLGQQIPLLGHRSFRIYKNDELSVYENIDEPDNPQEINNGYFWSDVLSLNEGDVLTFAIYASGRSIGPLAYLYLTINPGTSITIDDQSTPFTGIAEGTYPDVDYAVFPYHNPDALANIPDSLYRVDINDTKEQLSRFAPVVNYYRGGVFPYVVHGHVNNIYYSLLNLFSPAPYLACIIKQIFNEAAYRIVNNLFEDDDLKTIACITPDILNNYFPGQNNPFLRDFFPDDEIRDFIRRVCHFLGITFTVDNVLRTITFQTLEDILSDTSSVEWSAKVTDVLDITTEDFPGFILRTQPAACNYIGNYHKSREGLTIKGTVSLWNNLPNEGNEVNDCWFVTRWKAWFIWNYDPDQGVYNWIFHSIDYTTELNDYPEDQQDQSLTIELPLAAPANFVYHPEYPATDPTVGAGSRLWHIPAMHQAGNFETLPESYRSKPDYALVHYRGLQPDSNSNNYPLASNDVYKYNGNKIDDANFALRLDGDYGIYEKRWKSFIQWRLTSPGEYKIVKSISPLELSKFNFFRWYKIHGVDYLIKDIRFNIRHDHLTLSEITAHRR